MDNPILDDGFEPEYPKIQQENIPSINTLIISVNEKIGKQKVARGVFIFLGVFTFLFALYSYFSSPISKDVYLILLQGVIISVFYIILAIVILYNHILSISIGIIAFIALHFIGFTNIYEFMFGIVLKFPLLYFLVTGLIASFKIKKNLKALKHLDVPNKDIDAARKLKLMETF